MLEQIRHVRGPEDFAAVFDVSRETIGRLKVYAALLRQWQKTMNLVGPATLDDVWHRHFADSAQLLTQAPAARTWADLGSGAGFPGLVVAILLAGRLSMRVSSPVTSKACLRHDVGEGLEGGGSGAGELARVTLIESNTRKCAFLREVVRQTGMSVASQAWVAVEILSIRIENAATQSSLQPSEIVSARALASFDQLLELAAPLFASHTTGLFLKGRDAAKELETAQRMWNFRVELVQSCTEPDGRIIVVRRLEPKNRGMKP